MPLKDPIAYREYQAKWRAEHPDYGRVYWRDNPEGNKYSSRRKRYYEKNKLKVKARAKVQYAIMKKELIRPTTCFGCLATTKKLEAHHEDYSQPLEVDWFCRECHMQV